MAAECILEQRKSSANKEPTPESESEEVYVGQGDKQTAKRRNQEFCKVGI